MMSWMVQHSMDHYPAAVWKSRALQAKSSFEQTAMVLQNRPATKPLGVHHLHLLTDQVYASAPVAGAHLWPVNQVANALQQR